jgi:transcriptional regulator with PAS, ATPase and Fis domain
MKIQMRHMRLPTDSALLRRWKDACGDESMYAALSDIERTHVRRVLAATASHTQAADVLGITTAHLSKLRSQYDL